MINIRERNNKITHLMESVIRDYSRIYNTVAEIIEDGIMVYHNDEPLFYIEVEFNDSDFDICFYGFVFFNLKLSDVIKLKGVSKEDDIAEFLTDNSLELLFHEDQHLMVRSLSTKEYKDYSILKTAFAIELFEQITNRVTVLDHLAKLVEEREAVIAN